MPTLREFQPETESVCELDADFRRERFRYHCFYNEGRARIEMYLVSLEGQRVPDSKSGGSGPTHSSSSACST